MPTVHANGIDIHYLVLGEGKPGTSLVMTHGFAGPSEQWLPELEPLAEKRPVVVYDVRGHGKTSVPQDVESYSMPVFAADLASLLGKIGIERAHIGGVSMGGMVTAQFAVDYPAMCESVLIIDSTCGNTTGESPFARWEERLGQGIGTLAHLVARDGLRNTVLREEEWRKANDPHRDVTPYSLEDDLRRIEMMTVPGYLGAAHAISTRPDLTSGITSITAPTLVMIGEWDDFLPCAQRDHDLIPGSRLVVRERCGHGSRWRAETFVSEIEAFLADVEAGRPVAGERRI
ncbi:MAG: alpha/beta hydrolase [Dehalococcoidia bacterium]